MNRLAGFLLAMVVCVLPTAPVFAAHTANRGGGAEIWILAGNWEPHRFFQTIILVPD